jgi:hypothetical protein
MSGALQVSIGSLRLKNPVIAAPAEHMTDAAGVRAAIRAGAGVVVMKSTNESEAAKDQLQRAEYIALDERWQPAPWGPQAPRSVTLATRSGLSPLPFDAWLDQAVALDRLARAEGALLVPSLILGAMEAALDMARRVEQAGLRVLEFNIGTPYASQAAKGAVATELAPARVAEIVGQLCDAVSLPVWIKITGQSERVPCSCYRSAAITTSAKGVDDCGFWPVSRLPSLTTWARQFGPCSKTAPDLRSVSARSQGAFSAVPNSISSSPLSEVILRPAKGQRPFSSRAASSAAGPWQTAAMTFESRSAWSSTRPMSGPCRGPRPDRAPGDNDRVVDAYIDLGEDQRAFDSPRVLREVRTHAFRHLLAHRLRIEAAPVHRRHDAAGAGEIDPEAGADERLVEVDEFLRPDAGLVDGAVGAGPFIGGGQNDQNIGHRYSPAGRQRDDRLLGGAGVPRAVRCSGRRTPRSAAR